MSKLVITGASGNIGSTLSSKLSQIFEGEIIPVSRKNLNNKTITIDNYQNTPDGDILLHLAEESNRNIVNTQKQKELNEQTINLKSLVKKKYGLFIYFSTGLIYGNKGSKPFTENDKVKPFDQYTKLKIKHEKIVLDNGGMVLRLSNIIGNNIIPNTILCDIFKQLKNEELILKDKNVIRDFLSINDLSLAVSSLLKIKNNNTNGIYNIGSGKGITINLLAKKIMKNTLSKIKPIKSKVIYTRNKNYNVLSISKIKSFQLWKPKTSIDEIIKDLISNEKKNNRSFHRE